MQNHSLNDLIFRFYKNGLPENHLGFILGSILSYGPVHDLVLTGDAIKFCWLENSVRFFIDSVQESENHPKGMIGLGLMAIQAAYGGRLLPDQILTVRANLSFLVDKILQERDAMDYPTLPLPEKLEDYLHPMTLSPEGIIASVSSNNDGKRVKIVVKTRQFSSDFLVFLRRCFKQDMTGLQSSDFIQQVDIKQDNCFTDVSTKLALEAAGTQVMKFSHGLATGRKSCTRKKPGKR